MVELAEEKGFFQCPKCDSKSTLSRRNIRLGQRCSNCGTLMERKFEEDVKAEPTTLVVEEPVKMPERSVEDDIKLVEATESSDKVTEEKVEIVEEEKPQEKEVQPVAEPQVLVEDVKVPKTIAELEQIVEKDTETVDIEAEAKKLVEETKKKVSINTVGASDVKEIEEVIEEIKEEETG